MSDHQWVAFELHDGLLQWVLGARMQVAALAHMVEQDTPAPGTQQVYESLKMVLGYLNEAAEEGRNLIHFIEEHPDQQVDLPCAIEAFCSMAATRRKVEAGPRIAFTAPEPTWP
jgi:signal transduction histidine kinase